MKGGDPASGEPTDHGSTARCKKRTTEQSSKSQVRHAPAPCAVNERCRLICFRLVQVEHLGDLKQGLAPEPRVAQPRRGPKAESLRWWFFAVIPPLMALMGVALFGAFPTARSEPSCFGDFVLPAMPDIKMQYNSTLYDFEQCPVMCARWLDDVPSAAAVKNAKLRYGHGH